MREKSPPQKNFAFQNFLLGVFRRIRLSVSWYSHRWCGMRCRDGSNIESGARVILGSL